MSPDSEGTRQPGAVPRALIYIKLISIILGCMECLSDAFFPRKLCMWADAASCVHESNAHVGSRTVTRQMIEASELLSLQE